MNIFIGHKFSTIVFSFVLCFAFFQSTIEGQVNSDNTTIPETVFIETFDKFYSLKLKKASQGQLNELAEELSELVSKTSKTNPFVRSSLNNAALEFHLKGGTEMAIEIINLGLQFPSSMPGSRLILLNQKAEFLKSLGRFKDSIEICDLILQENDANPFRDSMHQAALTRKADLTLSLPELPSKSQREEVEEILMPLTEIPNTGPNSNYRGALMKSRIQNLKKLGKTNEAYQAGENFVKSNIFDEYSGWIVKDMIKLKNSSANSSKYKKWLDYFSEKSVPSNGGIYMLKIAYFNALAREAKYEAAYTLGEQIMADSDMERTGKVWWNDPGTLQSIDVSMRVIGGEISRKQTTGTGRNQKNSNLELKKLIVRTFIYLFIILTSIVFFIHLLKRFKKHQPLT